jgi:hypothetical protein
MKQKIFIGTLTLILLFNVRCQQSALELDNPNRPTESSYYRTDNEFIAASNSMYATLQKLELFNSYLNYAYDFRGDEFDSTYKALRDADRYQLQTFQFNTTNSYILGYWRYLYEAVYRTNILLEKLEPFNLTNPARKNWMLGEAKFLRGFAYYHLVYNFGNIPLFTNTTDQKKLNPSCSSREEVINQIIADWKEAKTLLPTPQEWGGAELGRATKGAAQAFLGRLYMDLGRYPEAKTELAEVINSNVYSIEGIPYLSNFELSGENNKESIFEIQFNNRTGDVWVGGQSNDQPSAETHLFSFLYGVPQSAGWNIRPSDRWFNEFEPGDPRKEASIFYRGSGQTLNIGGKDVPYNDPGFGTRKYHNSGNLGNRPPDFGGPFGDINIKMMRYAEVLLLYAEVLNETDGPAAALPYINRVRARVNMPAYPTADFPAATREDVFRILMHERIVELGGEQKRWLDLVRWDNNGKIDMNTYINRPGFNKAIHKVLPIPQSERDINPNLCQNNGY